jgi:hypothetical protein
MHARSKPQGGVRSGFRSKIQSCGGNGCAGSALRALARGRDAVVPDFIAQARRMLDCRRQATHAAGTRQPLHPELSGYRVDPLDLPLAFLLKGQQT